LKRLPVVEQRSVRSVVLEGLSLRQCGREQGVSAMTVQRRLRRGLQRLATTCSPLVC
jgi:RNA polymerase sigma-B factor